MQCALEKTWRHSCWWYRAPADSFVTGDTIPTLNSQSCISCLEPISSSFGPPAWEVEPDKSFCLIFSANITISFALLCKPINIFRHLCNSGTQAIQVHKLCAYDDKTNMMQCAVRRHRNWIKIPVKWWIQQNPMDLLGCQKMGIIWPSAGISVANLGPELCGWVDHFVIKAVNLMRSIHQR